MKVNSKHKSKDKILCLVNSLNNKHNLTLLYLIHQRKKDYYQIHKRIYYTINSQKYNQERLLHNHK